MSFLKSCPPQLGSQEFGLSTEAVAVSPDNCPLTPSAELSCFGGYR
ncbi:MAG: hypothetical protein WBA10_15780 [Elainellaceae cyanobacterium]